MLDERLQILGSISERRQPNRNHVEAIIEVFAERPVLCRLAKVAIGRRHDSDVSI